MDGTWLEEPCKHGAHAIHAKRYAVLFGDLQNTFSQLSAGLLQMRINLRMSAKVPDRRQAGRHGQRIPGKRARLIDRTHGRNHIHELVAAAVSAHRQPSANDLAQRRKIRLDSVKLLRAAQRKPETCHHFIHNQDRPVLFGDLAQKLQVAGSRRYNAHVAHHGFNNHTRNLVLQFCKCFFQRLLIVVRQCQREVHLFRKHAG
jgi:hypothetical protein